MPSPSVLDYFSGLLLRSSQDDKAPFWRTVTRKDVVFALISFVEPACKGVFMLKIADLWIFDKGLGVLVPMSIRLARSINDLGFF